MKKSRFTESQIISILKEVETGLPMSEICRKHGMSDATFYNWRSKYGGMDVSMMKRMKELEEENRRLKKMYAEEKLKAEIIQESLGKSGKAVSTQGDGGACSNRSRCIHSFGVQYIQHQ
jgi:putative transposase